ncbi:MAG: hypothetical protein Q9195_003272 [Heterodermia aff. obscurata]
MPRQSTKVELFQKVQRSISLRCPDHQLGDIPLVQNLFVEKREGTAPSIEKILDNDEPTQRHRLWDRMVNEYRKNHYPRRCPRPILPSAPTDEEKYTYVVEDKAQTIDIYLPVCNEPLEIFENTWNHIFTLENPKRKKSVFVLDDNADRVV